MSDVQVEITIQRAGTPDRVVALPRGAATIGRTDDNEVSLPDQGVSRRHVRLEVGAGVVKAEDLGSGNGTYFKGGRIHHVELHEGDQLYVDPFTLIFRFLEQAPAEAPRRAARPRSPLRPARLVSLAGARVDAEYALKAETVTLGRSNQREIVLYDPGASRLQAEIVWRDDGWWLVDGASANGTFLNGERVGTQRLQAGDRIRIGATEFRFEDGAPARSSPAPAAAPPPAAPAPSPRAPTLPPPVAAASTQVMPGARAAAASPTVVTARAAPAPVAAPRAPAPAAGPSAPLPVDVPPVRRPGPPPAPAPAAPPTPAPRRRSSALRRAVIAGLTLFALVCLGLSGLLFWLALNPGALESLVARRATAAPVEAPVPPDVARGLQEGRALFDQARYFDAMARYYEVKKSDPSNVDANRMIYLASEFIVLGSLRDGLMVRSTPAAEQQQALQTALSLADAARAGKAEPAQARAALERALLFFPGNPKATEALAALSPTQPR